MPTITFDLVSEPASQHRRANSGGATIRPSRRESVALGWGLLEARTDPGRSDFWQLAGITGIYADSVGRDHDDPSPTTAFLDACVLTSSRHACLNDSRYTMAHLVTAPRQSLPAPLARLASYNSYAETPSGDAGEHGAGHACLGCHAIRSPVPHPRPRALVDDARGWVPLLFGPGDDGNGKAADPNAKVEGGSDQCCLKEIKFTVVPQNAVHEGDGLTKVSWSVTIEVELAKTPGCRCVCCEVRYFVSWEKETSTQSGTVKSRTFDVLPSSQGGRAGEGESPYFVAFPGPHMLFPATRCVSAFSPFQVVYDDGKWFTEDTALGLVRGTKEEQEKAATGWRTPYPSLLWPLHMKKLLESPHVRADTKKAIEEVFRDVARGNTRALMKRLIRTGSESAPDDTTFSSDKCMITIVDEPTIFASEGQTVKVSRTYKITVTPKALEGCQGGDIAEREFSLSGTAKGGERGKEDSRAEEASMGATEWHVRASPR